MSEATYPNGHDEETWAGKDFPSALVSRKELEDALWIKQCYANLARNTAKKADRYKELIEAAFVAGRSRTSWEQFKKDNNL